MATLLPGQFIAASGASNFTFGSNMSPDYQAVNSRTNATIQQQIKAAGLTLMRCAIPANSADSYIDQTVQACTNMGCAMLVILDFSKGISWCQHLVSYLGSRCMLYEFRNEPDLGIATWQQYLADWNTVIPALRAINPGAAYIGPVLGVFANLQSYLVPWLQGCKSSGVLPDAVSFHIYPCTGSQWTATTCSARATSFADAAMQMNAAVSGVLGHTLPLALTEWNIDAASPVHSFATDPSFVPDWTKRAIDSMVGNYAICCQWDAGGNAAGGADDLIQVSTLRPNPNGQYQAMAERIAHYMSGTPTPAPIPTPTPTPVPTPAPSDLATQIGQKVIDIYTLLKNGV